MKADILIFYRTPTIPVNTSMPNPNIMRDTSLALISHIIIYINSSLKTANRNSLVK